VSVTCYVLLQGGDDDVLSDWTSSLEARTGVAVCTSTWKIVDVVSGDESTYAACQSASVRPQPDRTYYSSSNRLAVYFVGRMTSPGVVPSTPAASTVDHHGDDEEQEHHQYQQQQQQPRRGHSEHGDHAPLQLLHYTGQSHSRRCMFVTKTKVNCVEFFG